MEPGPVQDELSLRFVVASEKDRGRKDRLETIHDPAVPLPVFEEVEKVVHFGRSAKPYNPASLAKRERRHPNWNEAVLAVRDRRFIMHLQQ